MLAPLLLLLVVTTTAAVVRRRARRTNNVQKTPLPAAEALPANGMPVWDPVI